MRPSSVLGLGLISLANSLPVAHKRQIIRGLNVGGSGADGVTGAASGINDTVSEATGDIATASGLVDSVTGSASSPTDTVNALTDTLSRGSSGDGDDNGNVVDSLLGSNGVLGGLLGRRGGYETVETPSSVSYDEQPTPSDVSDSEDPTSSDEPNGEDQTQQSGGLLSGGLLDGLLGPDGLLGGLLGKRA